MSTKRKLKIFVDGYLLNKEYQGTKTYIIELYKEFAQENCDVLIYIGCFKSSKVEEDFLGIPNIKFIYFKNQSRILRMFFEIPKIIKNNKFDFAHFQYVIPFITSKSCKYIVTIHDILFNDFKNYFSLSYRLKRNFLFGYSAKKADYLLTVSEYSKTRLKNYYKLKNKEILITPNAVNHQYFLDYNKGESINYINNNFGIYDFVLYVSRIEPRKNQQGLLKAFLKLHDPALNLVFIGVKSINNNEFDSVLANLPTEQKNRIHVLENISEQDLLHFYKASKVFVYPTFAEGFGIPPLEAASLKIPVLCSNKTAMEDFSFFDPFFIDIENVDLFQEKLKHILIFKNDLQLEVIQEKIKENYNWNKSSKVISSIINKHS